MDKKEAFKEFLRNNKDIFELARSGKYTYQYLYETYDIYADDKDIWNKLINNNSSFARKAVDFIKKIDTDKLEDNVANIEKALSFLDEIISLKNDNKENRKGKEETFERIFDD